ncbi:MarR family winged helix-turn-helix transcriptional regulator [Tomitella fengzijianii]|uniref:MarR family winged helix-turn-helix transcriptional regulator n=1 Tax=Tomitella fengzijianii TaxID=2597660 RepID=UPI00131C5DDA|nr:MarR family winged helix-turn-helix transcriptional regulator [Tomitella fengzijianii]
MPARESRTIHGDRDADSAAEWTEAESRAAFDQLGDRLIDATRRFLRSSRRERIQTKLYTVGGRELSLAQVDALEVVAYEGEVRMHQLAAQLRLDPSTVTRATNPLVEAGLVERFTDPANRRYVVVRCTAEGRDAATYVADERRMVMREALAPMEPGRRLMLADLLEEYISLFEQTQAAKDDAAQQG